MGDLSAHFSRSEFACKCGCGYDTVDAGLIAVLEKVRANLGVVNITSGCRCEKHNMLEGGGFHSQHLLGRAADIKCAAGAEDVQKWLLRRYPDSLGIGKYGSFTHVDTRNGRARW